MVLEAGTIDIKMLEVLVSGGGTSSWFVESCLLIVSPSTKRMSSGLFLFLEGH